VFSNIFSRIFSRLKQAKNKHKTKPLIGHSQDMAVLRNVRKNTVPKRRQLKYIKKILSSQERKVIQWASIVLVIGLAWGGYNARVSYRHKVPAVGGTYTEAVVGAPELINPLFASVNDVDVDLSRLIYSGLMRYDENLQLVPDLAVSSSLSPDKKTYTFVLRQDVTWHDGESFSARDVAFTFERIQDSAVASPLFLSFQTVQVTVIDQYTVQFILEEPFQPFLSSLTVGILPEHVWGDIEPGRLRLTKDNLQPIGTGPFQFSKLAKDETGFIFQYELERFEKYYNQPPYIETFVFQFFGEYDTELGAIYALRQKKVDGLHFVPSYLKDKVERKHITIHTLQLPQYTALFFNQKKQPLLENSDVRTALSYALDKERILRESESLQGEGQVIYGPILPGFPGYDEDLEKTPYSLEEANTLLDGVWDTISAEEYRQERKEIIEQDLKNEMGVVDVIIEESDEDTTVTSSTDLAVITSSTQQEIDTASELLLDTELHGAQTMYRKDDEGNIISLRLVTADTPEYHQAADLIAGFWQDLGIQMTVDYVDVKDFYRRILKERNYDIVLYGIIIGSDPDQYPYWHSSQKEYPGLNLSQYVNRSVDELLEKARESSDSDELEKLYSSFQEIILKDTPAIFLHTPIYRYATTDSIHGVTIEKIFHPVDRFSSVTSWFVKTKGDWRFEK
jgi:ABC-type transport system substrate-binding protein